MRKLSFCFLITIIIIINSSANVLGAYGKKIQFNFNDVEIVNIIKFIGKATGSSFIFNSAKLKGKRVTFLSNQKFTANEAHRILEAILDIHRLSVINEGNVSRIVSSNDAKSSSTPLHPKKVNPGSYVTRIIPVSHANPRTILSSLNRLVSKDAILVSSEEANVLIIRDVKENTERFNEIVKILDQPAKEVELINLEIIYLEHANATEIAGLVDKIFSSALKSKHKNKSSSTQVKAFAEKRTNSLVLIADALVLPKIKNLITLLDKEVDTDEGNIRVYSLKNGNSKKIAEVLQKVAQSIKTPGKRSSREKADTKITIISDDPSNSLVIYADPEDFATLENVIEKLDKRRAQVFIQALIMETTLDKSLEFGIDWQSGAIKNYDTNKTLLGTISPTGIAPMSASEVPQIPTNTVFGVLGDTIEFAGNKFFSFQAFVKAAQTDSEINILSNPQILTLDNEEAQIKVGKTVPTSSGVRTNNYGGETYNYEYKDVGTELKITPQINFNNSIELKIYQNTSDLLDTQVLGDKQTLITTLNRTLDTTVIVEEGQTVALGGLIYDKSTKTETKTPCLGDIPVLGWFFKSQTNRTDKTNLMVFLTPRVIRNEAELMELTKKAKLKIDGANKGNFRVDISKEFKITHEDEKNVNHNNDASGDSEKSSETKYPKP